MANKLISEMGLPRSTANVFAARNIVTAKVWRAVAAAVFVQENVSDVMDALSLSEFELMEVLDVGLEEVTRAVAHISEISCPPYQTALSLLEQRNQNEYLAGHLPTRLKGLDAALFGGIPFGVVTELVGPAGIGKTQFCLKLALLASLPTSYGGLGGRVIYVDVESKFSSKRMIEMGLSSFPENISHGRLGSRGMQYNVLPSSCLCRMYMAGRILVLRPASLSEFTESLQHIKVSLLQHNVKLLIIDSMAALASGEYGLGPPKHHPLGWHISFIKSLAECYRIPVVVTNQVRSQSRDEASRYLFQVNPGAVQSSRAETIEDPSNFNSHLVAALGIHWAHAVTIRLVLEFRSGLLSSYYAVTKAET
ncbi:UNVERIFIED_CONTAM: DNA repair protein [Sesamum calycinum]|uniref:DNA repair protein n=1 Tax=Sesamum calycinum TaxID=2727403 RepID=A0AAW2SDJ7_9LAMI